MARRGKSGRKSSNKVEQNLVSELDEVLGYEQYKSLLKDLKHALKTNEDPQKVMERAKTYAAVRLASMAATEEDNYKALAVIKELFDRTDGRPTQKQEIEHKYDQLTEEQLDAVALSLVKDNEEDKKSS